MGGANSAKGSYTFGSGDYAYYQGLEVKIYDPRGADPEGATCEEPTTSVWFPNYEKSLKVRASLLALDKKASKKKALTSQEREDLNSMINALLIPGDVGKLRRKKRTGVTTEVNPTERRRTGNPNNTHRKRGV